MTLDQISHTIEDKITQDSLNALSKIDSVFIVGGIGVQLHVSDKLDDTTQLMRYTSDIDSTHTDRLDAEGFVKKFYEPLSRQLQNKYFINARKTRFAFEVNVSDGEDSLLVHTNRYSAYHFQQIKPRLIAEANRTKNIEINDCKLRVCSAEDIALAKCDKILRNIVTYDAKLRSINPNLKEACEQINNRRKDLFLDFDRANPNRLADVRANKDLFDLYLLDLVTDWDLGYMVNAKENWPYLNDSNGSKEYFVEHAPESLADAILSN